jgi:hypothetical protein
MAAVYVNNLVINSGVDFSQSFFLEASNSSTFNLTSYTANSQLRKWSGSISYVSFTTEISDPSSGEIVISLTSQQTTAIKPGRYIYDVVITDNFGTKSKVIEGMVLVREGVTR